MIRSGPRQYTLAGQTVLPERDLLAWAQWMEDNHDQRHVGLTRILDLATVSTVFLGLDHNWFGQGPPILFESMVFWGDEGGYEQNRCSTWSQAERMHAEMVRETASWRAFLGYFLRLTRDAFDRAKDELRVRMKEL